MSAMGRFSTKDSRSAHGRKLLAGFAVGILSVAQPAQVSLAQEGADAAAEISEVVVTGSRIARPEFAVPTPAQSFVVYPNPSTSYIVIKTGTDSSVGTPATAKVVDLLGQTVTIIPIEEGNETTVSTSQLSSGLYYLMIEGKKGKKLYHFSVQR